MKSKRPYFHGATSQTIKNEKRLRKPLTHAENILWQILRNRKVFGLKFRRQHPLGPFIADFYCHELSLVLEVDGAIHELESVKKYDRAREPFIKDLGLRIVRFTNDDVISDSETVIRVIGDLMRSQPIP